MGVFIDNSLMALTVSNTQTVSYLVATAENALAPPFQVQYALRRAPTKKEIDEFPYVEVVWHVWSAYLGGTPANLPNVPPYLGGIVPKVKDVIQDNGTNERWQVGPGGVGIQSWLQRYRLMTFRET
jgi:hypothetical protein